MELEEVPLEKKRNGDGEGASKLVVEVKAEEEGQPDHYAALQTPAEDIYAEASFGGSPAKAGKKTEGNARLYRIGWLFLTMICLVLLLAVIVLSVKLQTGSPDCQGTGEDGKGKCRNDFPKIQAQKVDCNPCGDGWLLFEKTCFYLSTVRLNWSMSKNNCTAGGGSLAVITSQSVQTFLTGETNGYFWIGLRRTGSQWKWVDNTALGDSYWEGKPSRGDCGLLKGSPQKNWISSSCTSVAYFICEKTA
ncbi:early activation antigen CD69-like [Limanda limanda]|uniref:early activation antigen CD69-like n=1 Tax=Limanda limanda TaxID=27771 RepID=UPI0029C7A57D|nr:early activation antigen CD69-like [Limanda limanda]